jgi:hypothetical protein
MKPIEERAETAFLNALRCVQYRIPKPDGLKKPAYPYAVAMRYGLIGAAAAFQVMTNADTEEQRRLQHTFKSWPIMVEEHVLWNIMDRVPLDEFVSVPTLVGQVSERPVRIASIMQRQRYTLDRCLELAQEVFVRDHIEPITEGWGWFGKNAGLTKFREIGEESIHYAMHFFDRLEAGLEEVPEIALLGE